MYSRQGLFPPIVLEPILFSRIRYRHWSRQRATRHCVERRGERSGGGGSFLFPPSLFLSSRKRQSGLLSFSFLFSPPLFVLGRGRLEKETESVDQPRTEYELFEKRLSLTALNESALLLTAEKKSNGKYCHAKIQKRRIISNNSTLLWALFLAILLLPNSYVLGYSIVQTPGRQSG